MGLGLLLGALAAGAAASYDSDSIGGYREYDMRDLEIMNSYERRTKYLTQKEKVEFFDYYRKVDNYIARLIGEGSGGVGLLINACRYQGLDVDSLNPLMSDLSEIRYYRNNLAHNKDEWKYLPDPKSWYNSTLSKVKRIVDNYENTVAKGIYRAAQHTNSKRYR